MSGDGTVGKACDVMDQVASFGRPVRFAEVLANGAYPKATPVSYTHLTLPTNREV